MQTVGSCPQGRGTEDPLQPLLPSGARFSGLSCPLGPDLRPFLLLPLAPPRVFCCVLSLCSWPFSPSPPLLAKSCHLSDLRRSSLWEAPALPSQNQGLLRSPRDGTKRLGGEDPASSTFVATMSSMAFVLPNY